MELKLIHIREASTMLGFTMETLRRWDRSGKFPAVRRKEARYYRSTDIDNFLAKHKVEELDLFIVAKNWVSNNQPHEPESIFYCQNSSVFQTKLIKLENSLGKKADLKAMYSLLVAIAGEIGNNSFDHNLGNWPDTPGIFFGYDVERREVVLADRGQGILKTLKRVKKELDTDAAALKVAFTEVISGRSPEARGNGLKFVREVVIHNPIHLLFQTGNAELELAKGTTGIEIVQARENIRGCMAFIKF